MPKYIDNPAAEMADAPSWVKKPIPVKAKRMDDDFEVDTLEGQKIRGKAGDYLVGPGAKGEFWPVDAGVFEATYRAA